jgi:hypothetical protein
MQWLIALPVVPALLVLTLPLRRALANATEALPWLLALSAAPALLVLTRPLQRALANAVDEAMKDDRAKDRLVELFQALPGGSHSSRGDEIADICPLCRLAGRQSLLDAGHRDRPDRPRHRGRKHRNSR